MFSHSDAEKPHVRASSSAPRRSRCGHAAGASGEGLLPAAASGRHPAGVHTSSSAILCSERDAAFGSRGASGGTLTRGSALHLQHIGFPATFCNRSVRRCTAVQTVGGVDTPQLISNTMNVDPRNATREKPVHLRTRWAQPSCTSRLQPRPLSASPPLNVLSLASGRSPARCRGVGRLTGS